jgi:hypothetical protein
MCDTEYFERLERVVATQIALLTGESVEETLAAVREAAGSEA